MTAMYRLRAALVFVLLAALLASCRGNGHSSEDAVALLNSAAARMERVQRFHFVLDHENGATTIALGFRMVHADGDVDGKDRLRTNVKGMFGQVAIDSGIVILGDQSWFLNPLSQRWER